MKNATWLKIKKFCIEFWIEILPNKAIGHEDQYTGTISEEQLGQKEGSFLFKMHWASAAKSLSQQKYTAFFYKSSRK